MKAVVISAGQGTRLLPLTLQVPKCLVEVHGRTILDHQVQALRAAGISQIVVVGGYRVNRIVEHLAAAGSPADVSLIFNPFWAAASSIGSVWMAKEALAGPFCLLNGDTIFDSSVIAEALRDARPGVNLLVEASTSSEHDDMRVEVAQQRVLAVSKDLPLKRTTHRSLGMVICPDADGGPYWQALQEVISGASGHNAFHHAVIDLLASTHGVTAIENHSGLWCEIDRPEDIEQWVQDHSGQPMRRKRG